MAIPLNNGMFTLHQSLSHAAGEGQRGHGFTLCVIWQNHTPSAEGILPLHSDRKEVMETHGQGQLPTCRPALWVIALGSADLRVTWNCILGSERKGEEAKLAPGTGWATSTWESRSHIKQWGLNSFLCCEPVNMVVPFLNCLTEEGVQKNLK